MTQKLYCYVDESGQDTRGDLFIVSVVMTDHERERAIKLCEQIIEQASGKRSVKWIKADNTKRLDYIRRVFQESTFKGKLGFAVYRNNRNYLSLTVLMVARAIIACESPDYKATVLIDGLPRAQERWVGSELRHLHVAVRKVRGIRRDENDAMIRLADALCGLVRGALEGRTAMKELVEEGKRNGFLKEL